MKAKGWVTVLGKGLGNGAANGKQRQALPLSELPLLAPQLNHKLHVLRTWIQTQVLLSNGAPPPPPLFMFPHSCSHTHPTPCQLHVILSFDVFGGLMSIPCAGSRGPSHRQIVVLLVVVVVVPVLENKYNNNYLDNNFRYLCFSRAQRKAK